MAVSIADLFVSVSADVSAAVNGLSQVDARLNGTTNAFRTAAPAALLFEATAAGVGAALATSINAAADFEHQMSGVKAVMAPGEVQQFSVALSDLALKLGRDTVFTSREAAAGIEELIKAGIPAQAVLEGAGNAALSLAAATGISVAEAATVAATAMNTFGVQVSQLDNVVNVLAGTANASAADISQLQFGLAAVGPVAAQMGLSLEDTAAALGIFANNGLRGQDAGTSLKTMLLNLIPNTKKQTEEFKKLGLITADGSNIFFNAEGHLRDLADISEILKGALGDLSDEQRIQALQTLFGTDAVRAAAILFKTGGDAVNAFHEEVGKTSAIEASKTRLDNLQGALQNLGGSIETAQIQIGNLFLPTIRDLADRARALVDAFSNLSPETRQLAVFIVSGAAAALGLLGALILLGPVIAALTVSMGALGAVFALAFGPVGLIIIALGALATALVFAFNTNEDFRNGVLGVWDAIQNQLWPSLVQIAGTIRDQLGPVIESLVTQFQSFVATVGPQVVDFFQTTLPAALATMSTQVQSLGPLFNAMVGFFESVFNVISAIVGIEGNALKGLFENVLVPGFQQLQAALAPLQPTVDALGGSLGAIGTTFTTIGAVLQPLTEWFNNLTIAINQAADAARGFTLPPALQPGAGPVFAGPPTAGAPPFNLNPDLFNGSINPGTPVFNPTPAAGGNTINVNVQTGPINSEGDIERVAQNIAAAIAAAADRVFLPAPNTGVPQLAP